MKLFLNQRIALLAMILMFLFVIAGCGGETEEAADQVEAVAEETDATLEEVKEEAVAALTEAEKALVSKMAAIANAVEASPATAAAVLEKAGLSAEEYEAELYKIAQSPSLSAAFEKAKSH